MKQQTMKQQTQSPLLTIAVALALVVAMAPPAEARLAGPGACISRISGVTTSGDTQVYPRCSGYTLDSMCLKAISKTHNFARVSVIDFHQPGFSGTVNVAVVPNDSRLPESTPMVRKLGTVQEADDRVLTNWYTFTGLQPDHHYTFVIYSPDPGYGLSKPFLRSCFITDRDPST